MAKIVRFKAAAGLVALGLVCSVAAGCGGAHKRAGAASPGATTGSNAAAQGATTTSSTVAGGGSSGAGTLGGSPGASPTTSVGRSPAVVQSPGTPSGSGGSAAPAPATPGTYTFDQQGGVTAPPFPSETEPPQGTLVVEPAQSNGVQVWHRYIDTSKQPADTDMQFGSDGPFILSAGEAGPQGNTTCTFNPPIAAPPWPPAAGKTFSSEGNCGSFDVAVQGKVTGSQSVTLKDGETFTAWVIDSTLTISGQVTGSGTQVDWYSPVLRLPLHEQVDMKGTYQGVNFQLHSVSDLVNSHPS